MSGALSRYKTKKVYQKIFEKHFNNQTSLDIIDKHIRSVIKTIDPNNEIAVLVEERDKAQFVKIEVFDRGLN